MEGSRKNKRDRRSLRVWVGLRLQFALSAPCLNLTFSLHLSFAMVAAGRVTRGSAAAADDLASLNTRDRLIFAQAVYEHGAKPGTWAEIAKLLTSHPLMSKTKSSFTAQSCSALHIQLLKESDIEWYSAPPSVFRAYIDLAL